MPTDTIDIGAIVARCEAEDAARAATVPWVETELAVHLNRLSKAVTTATLERNTAIVTASAAGHSLREIATATGLSHPTVMRIIERAAKAVES